MGTRRRFTPEYRRDVASLVLDTGSTIASVARDLGLGDSVVGRWVKLERERRQAELRPETWTLLMVAVMRLPVGSDPGILPGSGP